MQKDLGAPPEKENMVDLQAPEVGADPGVDPGADPGAEVQDIMHQNQHVADLDQSLDIDVMEDQDRDLLQRETLAPDIRGRGDITAHPPARARSRPRNISPEVGEKRKEILKKMIVLRHLRHRQDTVIGLPARQARRCQPAGPWWG